MRTRSSQHRLSDDGATPIYVGGEVIRVARVVRRRYLWRSPGATCDQFTRRILQHEDCRVQGLSPFMDTQTAYLCRAYHNITSSRTMTSSYTLYRLDEQGHVIGRLYPSRVSKSDKSQKAMSVLIVIPAVGLAVCPSYDGLNSKFAIVAL